MKAISKQIIFTFFQDVSNRAFENSTDWGFVIRNPTEDVKIARWGKALSVGNLVTKVKEGDYILIEPLMWTPHYEYEGNRYWNTSEDKVVAVHKLEPKGIV